MSLSPTNPHVPGGIHQPGNHYTLFSNPGAAQVFFDCDCQRQHRVMTHSMFLVTRPAVCIVHG